MKPVLYIAESVSVFLKFPLGGGVRVIRNTYKAGAFVTWGNDIEEYDDGVGTYTAALIEVEYGCHELIPATNVRFLYNEPEVHTPEEKNILVNKYKIYRVRKN